MLSTSLNLPFQGTHLLIFFIKGFVPKKISKTFQDKIRYGYMLAISVF